MSTIIYPIYTLMTHREFEWLWNIDKSEEKILEERKDEEKEKLRNKLEIVYEKYEERDKKTFEVKIRGNSYKYSCFRFEGMEVIELEEFPGKEDIRNVDIKLLRYGVGYVKFKETLKDDGKLDKSERDEIKKRANEIKEKIWGVVKDIKYNAVYKKDEDEVFEEEREALTGITFPLMKDKDFEEFYSIYFKNNILHKICKYNALGEERENILKNKRGNINLGDKDAEVFCMLHHGYLLCSKKVNELIIYSDKVWYQTKTYVDIRRGEYRPVMAYVRGLVNSIDLLKDMFHELIGINTKIWDKIGDINTEVLQILKFKHNFKGKFKSKYAIKCKKRKSSINNKVKVGLDDIREAVDRRIFCLDRKVGAISEYSEENISIRITDDMRATQRALETLEPAILTLGIIVFLDIVYKNMFSETITFPNPGIYDIAIITLSTLLSMFWICLNVVGYVRSFWLSVGAFKDPDDVLRDTFLLIFSISILILSMLTIGSHFELENPEMYVSLFSSISVVVFLLFSLFSKKKLGWTWMGFIALLSFVSVLFLKPEGIVCAFFLFYIVFMLWLFFSWFIKKIGGRISEGRETELWKEFKKERREKFREKIEDNKDPYKDWYFGEVFEKFIREFKKEKSEDTQRKIIKNISILLQALAVTFTIGYLIQKNEVFMLFISAIASLLTTLIEFQYYLHMKEDKYKKTEIKQFMPQYAVFALVLSIIADLHLIPAMFFSAEQQFAVPLAFGALIANAIALIMVITYTQLHPLN